jgi:putative FmdB family regulatory protein
MPLYTYRREDGTTFDYRQRFLDDPLAVCPTTGQKVVRIVHAPGIIFKGSGFYVNDSKKATNGNLSSSKGENGDSKPETKTEKPEKSETKTKAESAAD